MWGGEGLSMLGVQAGTAATEAQVRAVFGRLEHPSRVDLKTGEPAAAGQPAAELQLPRRAGGAGVGGGAGRHRGTPRGDQAEGLREAQAGGVLRPDVLPGQVGERVLGGAAGGRPRRRGRERRRGAPGRGRGGDGLRRGAGRLRAVGLSRQDRVGAVGRGLPAGPRVVLDPLGPLDQPRAAAAAAQPRDGAQPGRDDLRRGDPGAGQPRFHTDQAGRRRDLHEGLRGEARRLQRGGVRDPRGRQGARDRRVQLRSCWPRRPPAPPTSPRDRTSSSQQFRAGPRAGARRRSSSGGSTGRVAGDPPGEELRGGAAAPGVDLGASRCAAS